MIRYLPVLFAAALLVTTGCTFDVCSSKRMYVKSYEQFMKKVEKEQDRLTLKEWEEMDARFERFSGECFEKYEQDLTTQERKQIMRYHFKYVVLRVKSELPFEFSQEREKEVNRFLDELDFDSLTVNGRDLNDIWSDIDKQKFNEAMKEFGEGFEKLEKAFEEFGKEIRKTFEESREQAR